MGHLLPLVGQSFGVAGTLSLLPADTRLMLWIGIAIYIVGMILVGFWCSKRINGLSDFLVAGRRLPLWMATATLLATWFGAGSSMGVAGEVYASGIGGVIADPFGASLSLIIAGVFVVGLLRRARCMTVTDIVARRYGKWAGIYTSLWMVPVYIGWLGAQVMGMGTILNLLTDLEVWKGTLIAAGVVLIYTTVGGMWAVTMTDVIQVTFIIVGLLLIVPGAVHEAGGWSEIWSKIPADQLSVGPNGVSGLNDWAYYIGSWIVMGLGCVVGQDVIQRSLASKDEKVAVSSSIMAGCFYMAIAMVPITIGFAARLIFAKYNLEVTTDFENKVLPNVAILILGKLSPIILVLFLSALISAIMSSADSSLLAGSSLLVNNVVKPIFPKLSDRKLLVTTRIATLCLMVIATVLALKVDSIYKLMINSWASQLVIIFVPVITALYLKKASKNCAWAGMMVSTVFWLGYVFFHASGIVLPISDLAADGMTAGELLNSGIDCTKFFVAGATVEPCALLSDLAAAGTFDVAAAKDVLLSSGQMPFRLLMNCGPFDFALTCGAVYGFLAGLVAFLTAYFGERIADHCDGLPDENGRIARGERTRRYTRRPVTREE